MDLARFKDFELPFTRENSIKKYTFEVWIYSQTYVPGKFGTYSFIWNKYLKVQLGEKAAGGYYSICYPIWKDDYTESDNNKSEITFESNKLPWVYLRCSVDIGNKRFFHFQEKSFTRELDINITTDLTNVLSGTSSLKFLNENKNRGILFFRLLRLYNCYDCQSVDDYRINWINIKIIQSQIANNNLLYHLDGRIQGNELIERSNDNAETKQKLKYIMDSTGIKESPVLEPLPTTDFLGYNVLDITTAGKYGLLYTPQTTNHLCPENTYYCLGMIKLNEVEDVKIEQVTPSFSGKYTIEFWTMISDISKLTNGYHIIWKGLASVTLIKHSTNDNDLNMICWPQDFKFDSTNKIEGKFAAEIHTLASGNTISNKEVKTKSDINNKWLFVRCAVHADYKKYYSVLEDEKTIETPTVKILDATTPMTPSFNKGDTTYVLLNGMSKNDCTIYLRNLWLHSNYLLPNNILKNL